MESAHENLLPLEALMAAGYSELTEEQARVLQERAMECLAALVGAKLAQDMPEHHLRTFDESIDFQDEDLQRNLLLLGVPKFPEEILRQRERILSTLSNVASAHKKETL